MSSSKDKKEKTEEVIESRHFYVNEVAKTILESRADKTREDSFIFGLSGRWGEGKTHFLKQLEKELKNQNENIEVIWINPWKFGRDKISFLRAFLRSVGNEKSPILKRISNWFNAVSDFDRLYYDITVTKIHPGGAVAIILWVTFVLTLTFILPDEIISKLSNFAVVTLVGLPILIPLIGKVLTNQKSNKSISTIDQFDSFLKDILKNGENREIVINIDDLDRVTPQIARDVLDNLRTFFDKPQISFLVTGDHTVLERHLGRELLPGLDENLQLEEGRRFLKKIFDVYWQLPPPTDGELDNFIKSHISSRTDLNTVIKNKKDIENLQRYLKDYFKNNLREIIRFVDMLLFNFRIIDAKIESKSKDAKEIQEIEQRPMLFVRVRMIQELCPPLFKKIAEKVSVLEDLDRAVDREDKDVVDKILKTVELTPDQDYFIRDFLPQGKLFVEHGSVVVSEPRAFIRLAVDAGLDDKRGPSPEDFIERLSQNDPKQLRKALLFAGEPKLKKISEAFTKSLEETTEHPDKEKMIRTLASTLQGLEKNHSAHAIFVASIKDANFDFYRQIVPPEDRARYQLEVFRWLDVALSPKDSDTVEAYAQKFPYLHPQYFTQLALDENKKLGFFGSRIVTTWFNELFAQNNNQALDSLTTFLPFLEKASVVKTIDKETLSNKVIETTDVSLRDKIIELFTNQLNTHKTQIKEKVLNQISVLDQVFFSWAKERSSEKGAVWTKKDLEMQVVNKLQNEVTNEQELIQVLKFAAINVREAIPELWEPVRVTHMDLFLGSFALITNDTYFEAIPPPTKVAKVFLRLIVDRIVNLENISDQVQQLDLLRKDRWVWKNLTEKETPDRRRFAKITRSDDEATKTNLEEIINTWK